MATLKNNKTFFKHLMVIGLPITIQQLIMSSLNMVDTMMVGQLGDVAVASTGLANQINFFITMVFVGLGAGSTIFSAQYFGNNDFNGVRKVLGICICISLLLTIPISLICFIAPKWVLSIFINNNSVISTGAAYLKYVALGFLPFSITSSYSFLLKSTQQVKIPLYSSIISLSLNTLLNYILIYGKFGMPRLGVEGTAIATCISRYVECFLILTFAYLLKTPPAGKIREIISFDKKLVVKYFKTSLPVVFSNTGWVLAAITFNLIYAQIGVDSFASINIYSSIEYVILIVFISLSEACAIILGNLLGADQKDKANSYSLKFIGVSLFLAMVLSIGIFFSKGFILSFYKLSDNALNNSEILLTILSILLWVRATTQIFIYGIFPSGGDTKFIFIMEVGLSWFLGIPLALVGWMIFNLPVYQVFLLIKIHEIVKMLLCIQRYRKKKWLNNILKDSKNLTALPD